MYTLFYPISEVDLPLVYYDVPMTDFLPFFDVTN